MLHSTHTDWASPTKAARLTQVNHRYAAVTEVAAVKHTALVESSGETAGMMQVPGNFYSMDTAITALGFTGLWLMVLGGALFARRLRVSHPVKA